MECAHALARSSAAAAFALTLTVTCLRRPLLLLVCSSFICSAPHPPHPTFTMHLMYCEVCTKYTLKVHATTTRTGAAERQGRLADARCALQ